MNIKKGDTVKIMTGKNRGKTGKVVKIHPEENRISVEGINLYKKHVRPKREGEKGETVQVLRPFNASNAAVVCSSCGKMTRIGYGFVNGKKFRSCVKCKANL